MRTLSGEADLEMRGPRAGFDEMLYPRSRGWREVAVASPVLEVDAKLPGRDEPLRMLGMDAFRAALVQPELIARVGRQARRVAARTRCSSVRPRRAELGAEVGRRG